MPTSQPPSIPDVTSGPFSAYLAPPPAQSQFEQAAQQGPQFSGYERGGVAVAGFLGKFLQGASVGRARADAQALAQRTQKQQNDIDQVNKFIQVAQTSGKDPAEVQKMTTEAANMYKGMTVRHLEEAGKTNPLFKGLHMIAQTMLGGPPGDERTETDPKTGKKGKVKDIYEGIDHEKMNALWAGLQSAPTKEAAATRESQGIMAEAKSAMDKWQETHPGQEMTREDAQGIFNVAGLTDRANLMEQTYGVNPIKNHLESLDPRLRGTQLLQDVQARGELQFFKEDERMARGEAEPTGPPPQSPFSLPTHGPAEREQKTAIESGGHEKGWMPPAYLQRAVQYGRGTQQNYIIDDDREIPTTTVNGVVRDASGNAIDPTRIGKPIYDKNGQKVAMGKTDKDGKEYSVWGFEGRNGKVITAHDENGNEVRVPKTTVQTNRQVTQVFATVQTLEREINSLELAKNRIENQVANDVAFLTPQTRAAEVARRKKDIDTQIDTKRQNLEANQKVLEQLGGPGALYDTGGSAAPPGSSADLQDYFGAIK